jgi:hypothetical protein
MLTDFVQHIASQTGLKQATARAALGIVLNAAERQGSPVASEIFEKIAGARTLAASMGAHVGAATGVIARLIEQTPGGREAVTEQTLRNLQREGLGHGEIGALFPAISSFASSEFGIRGFGHLGDVFGSPRTASRIERSVA